MKKFLLGILRVLFELVQMILRPVGKIGAGLSMLMLILDLLVWMINGFPAKEKKTLLIIFGFFMFFSILWRIGTIVLPAKVKEEITVKVVDEKTGEEIPCEVEQNDEQINIRR